MVFTKRMLKTLNGIFFLEPGHSYVINAYGGIDPSDAYATAVDKETRKVFGFFN